MAEATLTVPAQDLRFLLADAVVFAGRDRSRPVLRAVNLRRTRTGLSAAATDSFALFQREMPITPKLRRKRDEWSFLIDLDDATRAAKTLAAATLSDTADLRIDGDQLDIITASSTAIVQRVPGEYPDADKLIDGAPTGDLSPVVAFNPDLLARIAKIQGCWARDRAGSGVVVAGLSPLKPNVFVLDGPAGCSRILVMPQRITYDQERRAEEAVA